MASIEDGNGDAGRRCLDLGVRSLHAFAGTGYQVARARARAGAGARAQARELISEARDLHRHPQTY